MTITKEEFLTEGLFSNARRMDLKLLAKHIGEKNWIYSIIYEEPIEFEMSDDDAILLLNDRYREESSYLFDYYKNECFEIPNPFSKPKEILLILIREYMSTILCDAEEAVSGRDAFAFFEQPGEVLTYDKIDKLTRKINELEIDEHLFRANLESSLRISDSM